MKLYTEEQLRKLKNHLDPLMRGNEWYELFLSFKPIELPSDEEIEKAASDNIWCESETEFYEGAKWVIEQIKQQGNGN